jgi:PhnB protein
MPTETRDGSILRIIPYICVRDAGAALEFYKKAFGAVEDFRLTEPSGKIGHAELKFGGETLMLADEFPEYGIKSPSSLGGSPVTLHMAVENVDLIAQRAVEAGATMIREPKDEFYGARSCRIEDPFGHQWALSQTLETLSAEEMQRRYDELLA